MTPEEYGRHLAAESCGKVTEQLRVTLENIDSVITGRNADVLERDGGAFHLIRAKPSFTVIIGGKA